MSEAAGKRKIVINVDITAVLAGFESAHNPTDAHHRIARHFSSPLLMGPPRSELLLELVMHMFTDQEAGLVQHLKPLRPRTAEQVAAKAGRSLEETSRSLDHLALRKMVVLGYGSPRKYTLLPIIPGTFEMALMRHDLSELGSWHGKFSELFERLWETRYFIDYPGKRSIAPVRYLPVGSVMDKLHAAWPSDKLEQVLEPYDLFAVGHCQCRLAMQMIGKGCGRATENCVTMGASARPLIERGMMRGISREDVIEIKRQAELEGSVTWMMNPAATKYGNGSCSCCGCCCHGLRIIKELNAPGLVSKPHFMPAMSPEKCKLCGKCVAACPMDALSMVNDALQFDRARCIGCGLCTTSCKQDAIHLEEAEKSAPYVEKQWKYLLTLVPSYFSNSFRVWAKRLLA